MKYVKTEDILLTENIFYEIITSAFKIFLKESNLLNLYLIHLRVIKDLLFAQI